MRRLILIAVLVATSTFVDSTQYTETVETTYGPVRGEVVETDEGVWYMSFAGIPYAAPPVGDLRFEAPQPPEKWEEVRDATTYGSACHQVSESVTASMSLGSKVRLYFTNLRNIISNTLRLMRPSEDCLSLNVYTKQLGEEGLKPVLVWIHGGAFSMGDGTNSFYGPDYLIDQDIVVVTINYRLGVLGFLATNTSDAPGNWGLKDQTAALRWVRDNIAEFGGDPKQVTIYGESAGGVSVHFHLLSPLSRGLFHRAIASSGAAVCSFATTTQQERFSRNLAKALGGTEDEVDDPSRRVQFLRTVEADMLTIFMKSVLEADDMKGAFLTLPFVPVVEPADVTGAFITEEPIKMLEEGNYAKVPLIMGSNDLEGGLAYTGLSRYTTPEAMMELNKDPCPLLPPALRDAISAANECPALAEQLRQLYFSGEAFDTKPLEFLYMLGDLGLQNYLNYANRLHASSATEENPFYLYYFTFEGEWNIYRKMLETKINVPGAVHADELGYVFNPVVLNLPDVEPGSREDVTKDRMISFITNFVKSGNPTPDTSELIDVRWDPATKEDLKMLHIDTDLTLETDILKARMEFWTDLSMKYLNKPIA